MRWLIPILVLAACGTDHAGPGTGGDSPDAGLAGDPLDVYRESCAGCHGPSGEGTVDGPQIQSPVEGFARYVTRNGRGKEMGFANEMAAFDAASVPDADLDAILAWLGEAPHPTTGQGLYLRYCGNCHGANAQGGRVGKDITRETDELREKVREGHGGTSYSSRTKYMPKWSATELSNADVALIEAYVSSLPAGPGGDDDDDDD